MFDMSNTSGHLDRKWPVYTGTAGSARGSRAIYTRPIKLELINASDHKDLRLFLIQHKLKLSICRIDQNQLHYLRDYDNYQTSTDTTMMSQFINSICGLMFAAVLSTPAWGQVDFEIEDLKLMTDDGSSGYWFGRAVDIDNGIIAVGAVRVDNENISSGTVFLYELHTGNLLFELLPDNGTSSRSFGSSIAIDNGVVAVGSSDGPGSGSVYLFDISTGTQIRRIISEQASAWDLFGWTVAMDDGFLAVGARWEGDDDSGAVFIFDVSTGNQLAMLGAGNGWSLAMSNGILAVGSSLPQTNTAGSVYIYNVSNQSYLRTIIPVNEPNTINFAHAVALEDGILVVGAWSADDNEPNSGSAYLFDVSTGNQISRILASDGQQADRFGWSVAIDNGVVAVGSIFHYNEFITDTRSGSVYLHNAADGTELIHLVPSDGQDLDTMGSSVAIDNGVIIVGAPSNAGNNSFSGSVYVYGFCLADFTNDGLLNFFDISAFLVAFNAHETIADLTDDGFWNFFDISAYLTAFAEGCP